MNDVKIDENIAWAVVDLETTGLDANLDVPLEFGIKLIDVTGITLHEESWLIHELNKSYIEGISRGVDNSFVNEMHIKSGLWDALSDADYDQIYSRAEFDDAVVQWLDDCGAPEMLGMMSNSTGSLDRPFTIVHFPKLNERLGYRNIDMSTIKELVKKLNPGLWDNLYPVVGNKSLAVHRVMSDIDACIVEYITYAREFLMIDVEI